MNDPPQEPFAQKIIRVLFDTIVSLIERLADFINDKIGNKSCDIKMKV